MDNKKGFIGGLVGILIAVFVFVGIYLMYQRMSAKELQETTQKAAENAGVEIETKNISPQGQVDSVRDLVGKVQDKENARIENEMK